MCLEKIVLVEQDDAGNEMTTEYKIKYIHERCTRPATVYEYEEFGLMDIVVPKGGRTIAFIGDIDNPIEMAEVECSRKDSYDKKFGRMIATGRLLKNLGLNTKLALPNKKEKKQKPHCCCE